MAFLESDLYRSFLLSLQWLRAHEARISLERPLMIFGLCWIRELSRGAFHECSVLQQTDIVALHWKILVIICLDVSVRLWMWSAEGCSQGGSWSQLQQVSCGLTSVIWMSIPSDRTAEGIKGQSMVGRDRNNKGTALWEFTSPFHGCTVRNSVLCFYFSHVSHTTCLIVDESVRPWGHKLLFVFLPWWKVLKESQRCYCNRN